MNRQVIINGLLGAVAGFIASVIYKQHPLCAIFGYVVFLGGIINSLIPNRE